MNLRELKQHFGIDEDGNAEDDKYNEEFLKFERVENPLNSRPDLCAFLLLHKLVPGQSDMVAAAGHDEIYLEVNVEKLAAAATPADILTLVRCGVMFDRETEGLSMFV